MEPGTFTFGQEPVAPRLLGPRGTIPMEAPAELRSTARPTDPLAGPESGVRARVTEPDGMALHRPTLPFVSPPRPMSSEGARRVLWCAFVWWMVGSVLFLLGMLTIAISLFSEAPAPPLMAFTPVISSVAAVTTSTAPSVGLPRATQELTLTLTPAVSSAPPQSRAPAPARVITPARRPSAHSDIVNPWGG